MNQNSFKIIKAALLLASISMLTACVHYGQFRDDRPAGDLSHKSIWHPEGDAKYYLGFIEVDDFGEMYDSDLPNSQLANILNMIDNAKLASPTTNVKVITFIHGWKNNASDSSGNVWGFRDELNEIAGRYPDEPVVGIYVGWRGGVTNIPVIKEFTFWDRRNAAIRIPGAHLTEILTEIMRKTKACIRGCGPAPDGAASGTHSLCVIVGHSFGGMVLERSLTQSVIGAILQETEEGKTPNPPADLIAMVNEAAPATEAKQLLEMMKRHKMKLTIDGREEPLFLSITSSGDAATAIAMPVGQFPSKITKSMRTYKDPQPPQITSQSTYYLHTTAHLPPLFSHLLGPEDSKAIKDAKDALDRESRQAEARCFGIEKLGRYCIVPAPNRYNDTPYWVMQMGTEFVPDHSTIFRPVFRQLLAQFIGERYDKETHFYKQAIVRK